MLLKGFFYYIISVFLLFSGLKLFAAVPCEVLAFSEHRLALAAGNDNGNGNNRIKWEKIATWLRKDMQRKKGPRGGVNILPVKVETLTDKEKAISTYRNLFKAFSEEGKSIADPGLTIWLFMVVQETPGLRREIVSSVVRDIETGTIPIKMNDFILYVRSLPDKQLDQFPFSALPVKEARIILSEMSDKRLLSLAGLETYTPIEEPGLPFSVSRERLKNAASIKAMEELDLPFGMLRERLRNTVSGRLRQLNRAFEGAGNEWRPDYNSHPEAVERLRRITVAYDVLYRTLYSSEQQTTGL